MSRASCCCYRTFLKNKEKVNWLDIFPENFQFENKKVRTADIKPILQKIAHFNRVNRKNKKRDKPKKKIYPVWYTQLSCFRNNR